MRIEELKKEIEEQGKENVRLYKIFEYKMHKEEMQPILQQWREGSKKIKELIKTLNKLEAEERISIGTTRKEQKTFVNGYGEATKRNITCSGYEKAEKRNSKAMMLFVGGK